MTSTAMPACSAKAAPTTRGLMARRFEESRYAMPRMTMMPATPSRNRFMSLPPGRPLPDHFRFGSADRGVQPVDQVADIVGDQQLGAARRRHEAAFHDMVHQVHQMVPEAADIEQ